MKRKHRCKRRRLRRVYPRLLLKKLRLLAIREKCRYPMTAE